MTVEEFEKSVNDGIDILIIMDIQRGLIDENFEPLNGHLSAEENKRCWECLAKHFVKSFIFGFLLVGRNIPWDALLNGWLSFLQHVNNVVKCGDRDRTIEDIIDNSGISEETWVRFLD